MHTQLIAFMSIYTHNNQITIDCNHILFFEIITKTQWRATKRSCQFCIEQQFINGKLHSVGKMTSSIFRTIAFGNIRTSMWVRHLSVSTGKTILHIMATYLRSQEYSCESVWKSRQTFRLDRYWGCNNNSEFPLHRPTIQIWQEREKRYIMLKNI